MLIVIGLYSVLWGKYREKKEMMAVALPTAMNESEGHQVGNCGKEASGAGKSTAPAKTEQELEA